MPGSEKRAPNTPQASARQPAPGGGQREAAAPTPRRALHGRAAPPASLGLGCLTWPHVPRAWDGHDGPSPAQGTVRRLQASSHRPRQRRPLPFLKALLAPRFLKNLVVPGTKRRDVVQRPRREAPTPPPSLPRPLDAQTSGVSQGRPLTVSWPATRPLPHRQLLLEGPRASPKRTPLTA